MFLGMNSLRQLKAIDSHVEGEIKEVELKKYENDFESCQDQHHLLSILLNHTSIEWMRSNIFLWNNAAKARDFWIETLKKDLRAVFLENNYFQSQVESKLSNYKNFWQFQLQDFKAGSGLIVF